MNKYTIVLLLGGLGLIVLIVMLVDWNIKSKSDADHKDSYEDKINRGVDLHINTNYMFFLIAIVVLIIVILMDVQYGFKM